MMGIGIGRYKPSRLRDWENFGRDCGIAEWRLFFNVVISIQYVTSGSEYKYIDTPVFKNVANLKLFINICGLYFLIKKRHGDAHSIDLVGQRNKQYAVETLRSTAEVTTPWEKHETSFHIKKRLVWNSYEMHNQPIGKVKRVWKYMVLLIRDTVIVTLLSYPLEVLRISYAACERDYDLSSVKCVCQCKLLQPEKKAMRQTNI